VVVRAVGERRLPGLAAPVAYLVSFENEAHALLIEPCEEDDTMRCSVVVESDAAINLPKPVTKDVADKFNAVLGR